MLALASSVAWGSADFLGGQQSRRLTAYTVLFWSQLVSGLLLAMVLLVVGPAVSTTALSGGLAAGVVGAVGLLCFYRAMSIGAISLVTTISACGVVLTVLFALASGETPGTTALIGVAAAVVGVVLVSGGSGDGAEDVVVTNRHEHRAGVTFAHMLSREALVLALCAALGFSLFFILLNAAADRAGGSSELWVTVGARAGSLITLCVVLASGRVSLTWPGWRMMPVVALVGVLDVAANAMFTLASTRGNLAIVAVLGSLYPATAVLLARFILHERLARSQNAGILLALAGVACIAGTR